MPPALPCLLPYHCSQSAHIQRALQRTSSSCAAAASGTCAHGRPRLTLFVRLTGAARAAGPHAAVAGQPACAAQLHGGTCADRRVRLPLCPPTCYRPNSLPVCPASTPNCTPKRCPAEKRCARGPAPPATIATSRARVRFFNAGRMLAPGGNAILEYEPSWSTFRVSTRAWAACLGGVRVPALALAGPRPRARHGCALCCAMGS